MGEDQLFRAATFWKSEGTSNSDGSIGPSWRSVTSEPQLEVTLRVLPSIKRTSLLTTVLIFRGHPVSTPVRCTSRLSILSRHGLSALYATTEATTTPPFECLGRCHSGMMESSMYQPSISLSELREHAPGLAMRFSRVTMCRAMCPNIIRRSPV